MLVLGCIVPTHEIALEHIERAGGLPSSSRTKSARRSGVGLLIGMNLIDGSGMGGLPAFARNDRRTP